ncbi:MAG TPA: N-acetylmuramoyl-L-alanine amidase [Burkholderiales bacterium]|nr:N-acetylmuramoyl-L-alanine amidase [Burkholderiales bacterium]
MRTLLWLVALVIAPAAAHEPALVAVDVGHFLAEPGALSARGRPELGFNRALALDLRDALEVQGDRVRLIGAAGDMAVLSSRTAAARGASLLLSVHHDSVQPHYLEEWRHEGETRRFSDRFSGFALFVSRRNPDPAASLACASAIGARLRAAGFAPSLYHAEPIPGESKPFADRLNGVHYFDNLVVLHTATQPAVLLEAGVIVNRAEELVLRDPATQRRIAQAVAAGVAECLAAGRKL